MTVNDTGGVESVRIALFLLNAVAAGQGDVRRLARDARLPAHVLAQPDLMISPRYALRMWELAEHHTGVPELSLDMAARYRLGELGLFDYLFSTAGTLRDAFQATMDYLPLMTTNARLQIAAQTDAETTYSYRYLDATGRGAELYLQFSLEVLCRRASAGTGQTVTPVRVELAHPAPRSHRAFSDAFGTRNILFHAPVTSFTLRTRDLDLPMLAADPVLARILAQYAAVLPKPPHPASWRERFGWLLEQGLGNGTPSLDTMARRLAVSRRTLQRQLAESDTGWRAELDAARQRVALESDEASQSSIASQLGYGHARSLRRARQRWEQNRQQ